MCGSKSITIGEDDTCASLRDPEALESKLILVGALKEPTSTPFKYAINPSSIVTLNSPLTTLFLEVSN